MLLVRGIRWWPAVLVGALAVNWTTSDSVGTSLGIAAGNTLEALAGAFLVARFAGGRAAFERPEWVVKFTLLAGLLSTAISATVGVISLRAGGLLGSSDAAAVWVTRRRFQEELAHQLALARRYGSGGAILFLDLDDFKSANDRLGHVAGDRLLASLAELLRGRLRDSDIIARLGGDEFAVLLPRADSVQAQAVAAQLLDAIASQEVAVDGGTVRTTIGVGIARFPEDVEGVDELLTQADTAMYEAKAAGGGLFRVSGTQTAASGAGREAASGPGERRRWFKRMVRGARAD